MAIQLILVLLCICPEIWHLLAKAQLHQHQGTCPIRQPISGCYLHRVMHSKIMHNIDSMVDKNKHIHNLAQTV